MSTYSEEFLEKTIRLWQPFYPFPLSKEDAKEIADNMVSLYRKVLELERTHTESVMQQRAI